jgi:signal transduction histidine kinase
VRHAISRPFVHEDGDVYRCVSIGQARDGDQVRRSLRAQTLESLGELASGMAHEINTPTQYIGDNLGFLLTSFEQLAVMAVANGAAQADVNGELAYLLEEIPTALAQSREGLAQVGALVEALQQVATFTPRECEMVDANRELDFALTIARNVWKYIAQVTRDLDPALPLVRDASGTLRQIALRLVLDAVRTVQGGEQAERGERGVIAVRTWIEGDSVALSVRAGGTRRWASESGLHLVREAVGGELEGTVDVDHECEEGTTVTVRLPSAGSDAV